MRVLFVAALEEETRALAAHVPVHHLGVGKVQAAASLAAGLAADPADLVVNVGTAGGLHGQPLGTVVEVARVHQHDFDHAGVSRFVGRPLRGGPLELGGPHGAAGRLATGDRLVASPKQRARLAEHADVVDMEGYAVAAVARAFGREVWLTKVVSDGADAELFGTWHDGLRACGERLADWAEGRGLLA
ncbi:nucleosidase [Egicoccus sp. AB-alg2]|uniref:nucleosidase n=1 Tax=Egicoccus sp. AB-alg2 TaxID=3242693 RepID=UPI00359E9975